MKTLSGHNFRVKKNLQTSFQNCIAVNLNSWWKKIGPKLCFILYSYMLFDLEGYHILFTEIMARGWIAIRQTENDLTPLNPEWQYQVPEGGGRERVLPYLTCWGLVYFWVSIFSKIPEQESQYPIIFQNRTNLSQRLSSP